MAVNRDVIGQAETLDRSDRTVLDMDSSESPVQGQQEGSTYEGHFKSVCYHPLFLFNDHGGCLAAKLRSGQRPQRRRLGRVSSQRLNGSRRSASAWLSAPTPPSRIRTSTSRWRHAASSTRSASGQRDFGGRDRRPPVRSPGRPSHKPLVRYKSLSFQAGSWTPPRPIVAKVEHHVGELFPRLGFMVKSPAPQSCRRAVL